MNKKKLKIKTSIKEKGKIFLSNSIKKNLFPLLNKFPYFKKKYLNFIEIFKLTFNYKGVEQILQEKNEITYLDYSENKLKKIINSKYEKYLKLNKK